MCCANLMGLDHKPRLLLYSSEKSAAYRFPRRNPCVVPLGIPSPFTRACCPFPSAARSRTNVSSCKSWIIESRAPSNPGLVTSASCQNAAKTRSVHTKMVVVALAMVSSLNGLARANYRGWIRSVPSIQSHGRLHGRKFSLVCLFLA